METIVQIIKAKLKLGKSNHADERILEADIRYLARIMATLPGGKKNPDYVNVFKELLLRGESNSGEKAITDGGANKNFKFHDLIKTHKEFLMETESGKVEIIPCDHLKDNIFSDNLPSGNVEKNSFLIKQFKLPSLVYDVLEYDDPVLYYDLESPLTSKNYVERFQALLWIEEASQSISLHRYDMYRVTLKEFKGNSYKLSIPGLAEGRPSLMCGDRVMLKAAKLYYEGFIGQVRLKDVIINLSNSLHGKVHHLKFDVFFVLNRTPYRRYHHAVVNSQKLNVLFPVMSSYSKKMIDVTKNGKRWFSKDLNRYQKRAVVNVLAAQCRPAPYIIFGPPGTGKTVTIVESILQVFARKNGVKILVCGNSNTCADSLAARIKASKVVDLNKIVRVSAYNRVKKQQVPADVNDITMTMDTISQKKYSQYQIVVTTCSQSCALNAFREKFDYVFIDEAGHACEPEALISIGLMKPGGCIVLAGDPHQLGPVCSSPVSKYNGLGTSLLERLCKLPAYQRRLRQGSEMVYDDRYLTKLIISYRSDSRVMIVNDELFYEKELSFQKVTPKKWLNLFHIKNPLLFQSIRGRDRRDFNDPSWFNANEAIMSICYAKRLYQAGLKPEQLGIITPYRLQIRKLNILFDMCQLEKCKIATVEEFQGDEREVIIISTVRASQRNIKVDQKYNLGFLFNPKLFNVAISRSKWLVIVLGDPDILRQDKCWIKYMESAQKIVAKKN